MWLGSKLTALSDYVFRTFFRVLFRYDIFISYARRDGKDYAVKLRDQLRQLDFSCFLDYDELPAGNSLNSTLRRALRRSATLVLVGTERAVSSRYVELEVGEFASTGRAIIPIDIEGSLADAPWAVVRERDLVWIDEARTALERGVPSPNVADQIDKLFKYTRRNSRVRAQVLATLGLFIVVVAASLFLIQRQVNAAQMAEAEAERQTASAAVQKRAADDASARAEEQTLKAERATQAALKAQRDAEEALKKVEVAEKAAGEATAEAKRQEQSALASAGRARREQQRAEAERARAEEGTRYLQSQSAATHASLALEDDGELEQSALLAVESLKKSLTPEGYSAWGQATGLLPRALPPDPALAGEGEVTAVAYSPKAGWVAVGVKDGAILRGPGGREPVRLRMERKGEVTKISFARHGELIGLAGEGYFELWDVRGPKRLMSLVGHYSNSVAVSPDGRYVAAAGPEHRPHLQVYDTSSPSKPLFESEIEGVRYSMSADFDPAGRWLAVACAVGKVVVWDASGFAAGTEPKPHTVSLPSLDEIPSHVSFGSGGNLGIISRSNGGVFLTGWRLRLHEGVISLAEKFRVPMQASGEVLRWSLTFSRNDTYVAVVSRDRLARVWETAGGREVARIGFDKEVKAAAFSRDGSVLTTVGGGVAESWKTEFGPAPLWLAHAGEVEAVAVSPRGEWLATAGKEGARLFRTSDWSEFKTLDALGATSALNFSPDGRWLVVKGEGKGAVFDTRTWQAASSIGPLDQREDLGAQLLSRGEAALGFSPDGRWLVVEDGRFVKLLEAGSWREAHSFEHSDPVREVSFSPDGRRLSVIAEGSYKRGIMRVFDRRERAYVWSLDAGLAACGTIEDKYTPNAEKPERPRAAESVPCPEVKGHAREQLFAEALGWAKVPKSEGGPPSSPDGRWSVTAGGGSEASLAFKEGNAERKVASLTPEGRLERWAFTPDSRWLLVADGTFVRLWPLKQADLIAEACARLRRRDLPGDVWQKYFSGEKSEPTCVP